MKYLILFTLTILLFAGCDVVYPIWDFPPWNIGLVVKNSSGDNLLEHETEGNIIDNSVVVDYNGTVYEMWDARTRYIPSEWFGLRIGKYWYDKENGEIALLFGEFSSDTTDGYHGETFTIYWGDGTSDKINFEYKVTWGWGVQSGMKHREEAVEYKRIWLNGVLASDNSLIVEVVK